MIKSPCKDCNKYESGFPECFEGCEIIQDVQRLNSMMPSETKDTSTYVPSEGHSFRTRSHKAMS